MKLAFHTMRKDINNQQTFDGENVHSWSGMQQNKSSFIKQLNNVDSGAANVVQCLF